MNFLTAFLTGNRKLLTSKKIKNDLFAVTAAVVLLGMFNTLPAVAVEEPPVYERVVSVVPVELQEVAKVVAAPVIVSINAPLEIERASFTSKPKPTPKPKPKPKLKAKPVNVSISSDNSVKALQAFAGSKLGSSEQLKCLVKLWNKESQWNYKADNPSSSAYGIPQSLPGSKMASAGADWATNPRTQIKWGLGYIKDRYGVPCNAWAHSVAVNWY